MKFERSNLLGFGTMILYLAGCTNKSANQTETAAAGSDVVAEAGAPIATSRGAAPAQPAPPPKIRKVMVDAGTNLRIRTIDRLSTKTAVPGQTFAATLEEPLLVEGLAVADKGAPVTGVVTEVDDGGRVKGLARIAVRITRLQLSDGSEIEVQSGAVVRRARATKKKDATKIGIGSGIGAAIGAIAGGGTGAAIGAAAGGGAGTGVVLATHGDPAVIASESVLTFRLRTPVEVRIPS